MAARTTGIKSGEFEGTRGIEWGMDEMSLTSSVVGSSGHALAIDPFPAKTVRAETDRTKYSKVDPNAAQASRNQVLVKGPMDFEALCCAKSSGKALADRGWEDMLVRSVATREKVARGEQGDDLIAGITKMGWERPMPVQQACVPLAKLRTTDGTMVPHILAQAENGSGKTGAFCLAAIFAVGKPVRKPRCLIVTTT